MNSFILNSIVLSVALTLVLNLLPMLFPKASRKIERKVQERITQSIEQKEQECGPKIKVFFPWKLMIIASLVLTVLVNLVGYFSH